MKVWVQWVTGRVIGYDARGKALIAFWGQANNYLETVALCSTGFVSTRPLHINMVVRSLVMRSEDPKRLAHRALIAIPWRYEVAGR